MIIFHESIFVLITLLIIICNFFRKEDSKGNFAKKIGRLFGLPNKSIQPNKLTAFLDMNGYIYNTSSMMDLITVAKQTFTEKEIIQFTTIIGEKTAIRINKKFFSKTTIIEDLTLIIFNMPSERMLNTQGKKIFTLSKTLIDSIFKSSGKGSDTDDFDIMFDCLRFFIFHKQKMDLIKIVPERKLHILSYLINNPQEWVKKPLNKQYNEQTIIKILRDRKIVQSNFKKSTKASFNLSFKSMIDKRNFKGFKISNDQLKREFIIAFPEFHGHYEEIPIFRNINSINIKTMIKNLQTKLPQDITPFIEKEKPLEIPLYDFEGHGDEITDIKFFNDGKTIVSSSNDSTIRISNLNYDISHYVLHGKRINGIESFDIDEEDNFIVQLNKDNTIQIWSYKQKKLLKTIEGVNEYIYNIKIVKNRIITIVAKNKIIIWDLVSGKKISEFKPHNEANITNITKVPGSYEFVTVSEDNKVCLWNSLNNSLINELIIDKKVRKVFVPENNGKLIVVTEDEFQIWNIKANNIIHSINLTIGRFDYSFSISPDGKYFCSSNHDGNVELYSIISGKLIHTFTNVKKGLASCTSFSPNGELIASGNTGRDINIWNIKTGKLVQIYLGSWGFMFDAAISDDAKVIISTMKGHRPTQMMTMGSFGSMGGIDMTMWGWNLEEGRMRQSAQGSTGLFSCMTTSPTGNLHATGVNFVGSEIVVLSGYPGKMFTIKLESAVSSLAITPDDKYIISGHSDGKIQFWNSNSGELVDSINDLKEKVLSIKISKDDKTFKTKSGDFKNPKISFWSLETKKEIEESWSLSFSEFYNIKETPQGIKPYPSGDNVILSIPIEAKPLPNPVKNILAGMLEHLPIWIPINTGFYGFYRAIEQDNFIRYLKSLILLLDE